MMSIMLTVKWNGSLVSRFVSLCHCDYPTNTARNRGKFIGSYVPLMMAPNPENRSKVISLLVLFYR